jgi:hypothetical protein
VGAALGEGGAATGEAATATRCEAVGFGLVEVGALGLQATSVASTRVNPGRRDVRMPGNIPGAICLPAFQV